MKNKPSGKKKKLHSQKRIKRNKDNREIYRQIGAKIETARKILKFSYKQISEESKIKIDRIMLFERGKGRITIKQLWELAKAMHIDICHLLP